MASATIATVYGSAPRSTFDGTEKIPLDVGGADGAGLISKVKDYVLAAAAVETLAGGTITTSQPLTLTQTWNAGGVTFTGLLLNITATASAAASLLADFQVAGVSQFNIGKTGTIQVGGSYAVGAPQISSTGSANTGISWSGPSLFFSVNGSSSVVISSSEGSLKLSTGVSLGWSNIAADQAGPDLQITRKAAASLRLGTFDAAAPIAQTLGVQSVIAGTSNTAGALFSISASQGTGTGAGGDIAFNTAPAGTTGTSQNALAEVMRVLAAGNVKFTNAANFSANGSVATAMSSVGPTGSHTTVQEWLTIVNASGVTRYIPCF